MQIPIQPNLENENVKLVPLSEDDFESLFEVASDPKVWEQHPNKDRYKKEVFQVFFEGALASKGAFKIIDKKSGKIAGSSRFYDYDEKDKSILIGYTFYGTQFWGSKLNPQTKKLMMDYIFRYVEKIYFHVGKDNIRSQKAMEKLGAVVVDEREVAYYGEPSKTNLIYEILKPTLL